MNLLARAFEGGVRLPAAATAAASSFVAFMLITINDHDVKLDAINVIAIKGAFNDDATLDAMEHDFPGASTDAYFGAVELKGESFEDCCVTNDHSWVEDQYSFGILGFADVVMANVAEAIRVVHHLDHRCFTANATTYYFNY